MPKRLNEILPYGNECRIKKIECMNHLLRNYCTKLTALTKRTDYPIAIRNYIAKHILRFHSNIRKAIDHHLTEDSSIETKIVGTYLFNLLKLSHCCNNILLK